MVTLKTLQKPKLIDIKGSKILIQHPDISTNPSTFVRSQISAGATALSVGDNDEFIDNDWFIIGRPGDAKTEEDDVNGTPTRGTSLTVTNTLKFAHEINDPVTKIYERKITIYSATSDGGSLTAIVGTGSAIDIAWNRQHTEYPIITTDTTTGVTHYVVKFYDGVTESAASDYIPIAGNPANSVSKIAQSALALTSDKPDTNMSWEDLVEFTQDAQDEIVQYIDEDGIPKNWSFEIVGGDDTETWLSAVQMENKYALSGLTKEMKYADGKDSIISVQLGHLEPLDYITPQDYDTLMDQVKRTDLAAAVTAGATSFTVNDSSYLASSGTLLIGTDSVTYTSKTDSTGTISGVPASGTGSFASSWSAGASVWQGVSGQRPYEYTIYNGNLFLSEPLSSTYASYKLKLRYYKKLTTLTEITDTTDVSFYNIMKFYVASRIKTARRDEENAVIFMNKFKELLAMNAKAEESPTLDTYSYYNLPSTGQSRLNRDVPFENRRR